MLPRLTDIGGIAATRGCTPCAASRLSLHTRKNSTPAVGVCNTFAGFLILIVLKHVIQSCILFFNSVLKMKEELELLNKIEQYVPQYGFEEIYERTFCSAIDSAQSEKNSKRTLK